MMYDEVRCPNCGSDDFVELDDILWDSATCGRIFCECQECGYVFVVHFHLEVDAVEVIE